MPICLFHILITGKTSAFHGVQHISAYHGVTFLRRPSSPKLEDGCLYLCNHRSWADFFIDQTLCGGAAYLSRKMVMLGTPMSSFWAWLSNSTWFFTRKKGLDREKFFEWIESKWQTRPEFGLIAYPEGTRNHDNQALPLKSGVLQYAYNYKRKVQVLITTNKEKVVNEKKLSIHYGVACVVEASEVIHPTEFDSFELFKKAIKKKFTDTWEKAYSASLQAKLDDPSTRNSALKQLKELEIFDPPLGMKEPVFEAVPLARRLWISRSIMALVVLLLGRRHGLI